jgi:hypothetical protein
VRQAGSFRQAGRGLQASARALTLLLAGLLAACGSNEGEQQPAPASADEARALEDAADMLEEQRHAPEPTPSGSSPSAD